MKMQSLGNSDIKISSLGMGTWAIGGDGAFGWGLQDDAQSIAAIRRGVERGINWIDTAPVYGLGHAENIVAKALKEIGRVRRPLVFTKCGLVWNHEKNVRHCLKTDSIRMEVDACLQRLQTDVLDLCQIHWPSFPPGSSAPDIEEAWTVLADLVEQGKIRHIGVSNFDVSQLKQVQKIAAVTSLQPPYSMLMRSIEDEIFPYCEQQNIGVIVYSPLHNGMLSGTMTRKRVAALPTSDWRGRANPAFREPHLSRNLTLVELLSGIGNGHGRSAGEVAIAWTLRHSAVTAAIVGVRNAAQVDGIIGAADLRLSESEMAEIETNLPESIEMLEFN